MSHFWDCLCFRSTSSEDDEEYPSRRFLGSRSQSPVHTSPEDFYKYVANEGMVSHMEHNTYAQFQHDIKSTVSQLSQNNEKQHQSHEMPILNENFVKNNEANNAQDAPGNMMTDTERTVEGTTPNTITASPREPQSDVAESSSTDVLPPSPHPKAQQPDGVPDINSSVENSDHNVNICMNTVPLNKQLQQEISGTLYI